MTDIWAWQHAYAMQAEAGFEAYHILRMAPDLPQCLALHSLQMACEKLSKAYLCSAVGAGGTGTPQHRPLRC